MTPTSGLLGTVVVRAWIEAGDEAEDVRARVLVVRGTQAELQEIGVAAGIDAVLSLVSEGLHAVGDSPASS